MLQKYGVDNPMKSETFKNKVRETNLEKYGYEYGLQSEEVKNKGRNTVLRKYGVNHIQQVPKFKQKILDTILRKYGKTNISQTDYAKEKKIKTALVHFGVEHHMKLETYKKLFSGLSSNNSHIRREKSIITCINNFGVDNPFKSVTIRTKIKETMMKKYGVSNPMQVPEFFEKAMNNAFKRKEYIWNTGEISLVQGYEPIVLKELEEQGYRFEDILTSPKDMPMIMYQLDEKEHRYYPDIFIPKDNIVIEVKSNYTMLKEFNKNLHKAVATKSLGFDFRLEVR